MTHPALARFIADAAQRSRGLGEPADCVLALAPLMLELIAHAGGFLEPRHRRADGAHYARHLIHDADDGSLSLYSIVWQPGQWTPVHDHGSWGVVGVVEGVCWKSAAGCACRPTAAPTATSTSCAAA
jgi:3-mercaptopropionate dioxygenase